MWRHGRRGRRLAAAVVSMGTLVPGVVLGAEGMAGASGCVVVANPSPGNATNCAGESLEGANFSGDDLEWANFAGADLNGANLSGANLENASLEFATFENGNGSHADFTAADLYGATMSGTNLNGAGFSGYPVLPSSPYVEATSPAGAEVTYGLPTGIPGATTTSCSPGPGAYPVGHTLVRCTVLDDFGNVASGVFDAYVAEPTQTVAQPVLLSASGNELSMTATVTETYTGLPVSGVEVDFWSNDPAERVPDCGGVTDASGTATCSLLGSQAGFGAVPVAIVYGGYTAIFTGTHDDWTSRGSAGLVGTG